MSYPLRVRSTAERDLADVIQWYQNHAEGIGIHFVRCVDAVMESIARNPEAYPIYYKQIRRTLVHRFPFGVFFVFENEMISILAVLHLARDPDKIKEILDRYEGES